MRFCVYFERDSLNIDPMQNKIFRTEIVDRNRNIFYVPNIILHVLLYSR
jgi:hypothetical protein